MSKIMDKGESGLNGSAKKAESLTDDIQSPNAKENKSNAHSQQNASDKLGYIFSWLLFVLALVVLVVGAYITYDKISKKTGLQIVLSNTKLPETRKQQVSKQLQEFVHGNFFTTDIHDIKNQIGLLDWVQSVKVNRVWPNTVSVDVLPRYPIARYGSERLLSSDGGIYSSAGLNQKNFSKLPLLYGPKDKTLEVMKQFQQLNQWFAQQDIHLTELSLTEQMTWFLKFNSGLRVIVDKEDSQKKLYRLSLVLQSQLKPFKNNIKYVDLRYRNGMAIAWKQKQPDNLKAYLNTIN